MVKKQLNMGQKVLGRNTEYGPESVVVLVIFVVAAAANIRNQMGIPYVMTGMAATCIQ